MAFYRWRLRFSVMRPRGARDPHSLPLSHQLADCIHRFDGAKLILSRMTWVLSLRGSVDISRRKLNVADVFVAGWAWVWGRWVNGGTVPVSAAVLAWQQKGRVVVALLQGEKVTQCPPLSVCENATLLCPVATLGQNLESLHSWRWQGAFILNAWLVQTLLCPVSRKSPLPTSHPVSDKGQIDSFSLHCLDYVFSGGTTARGGPLIDNYQLTTLRVSLL